MKARRWRRLSRTVPYVALLVFWGMGLWRLGEAGLWYDEIINADFVLGHTFGELLHLLRVEQPYPPLYGFVLKVWGSLARVAPYQPGLEPTNGLEMLLRFPTVVAAVLNLAVAARLARRLRLQAAVALPLLLACHPTFSWYARDARLYAMLMLWLQLALLGLLERRCTLWVVAGSAALLTHYFALFPLVGAALGAWLLLRPRWRLDRVAMPFVLPFIWGLVAFRVTVGFESFAPESPPSLALFLSEIGPDLLSAGSLLAPLSRALDPAWGFALLALGLAGLVLLSVRAPSGGGTVATCTIVGLVGTFLLWQLRAVHHVRYLTWALPLVAMGVLETLAALGRWLLGRRGVLLFPLVATAVAASWGVACIGAILSADRTLWYEDYRGTVAFLNEQALEGDRGVVSAGHAIRVFTAYGTRVPFKAGPSIGERLDPQAGVRLLQSEDEGRWWLFLYQDDATDPGGILMGTLEAAGGYRTDMWYNRELRLFAYSLPDGARLAPLVPQQELDVAFEGGIDLVGFSVHREGDLLIVYLFWRSGTPQTASLTGTVHLVRQAGERPIVQRDKPVLGVYWPLSRLPVGENLADRYELILPADLPEGAYRLLCALYDPQTGERLGLVSGRDIVDLGEIVLR